MKTVKYPLDTKKSCSDFRAYCHIVFKENWNNTAYSCKSERPRANADYLETCFVSGLYDNGEKAREIIKEMVGVHNAAVNN